MKKKPDWLPNKFPVSGEINVVIPIVDLDKTGTQIRVGLDDETVEKYAEVIRNEGFVFPPVEVVWDGERAILAEGFHRTEATLRAGFDSISCRLSLGTRRDAFIAACSLNKVHGLPLSNADKRKVVGIFLEDEEWAKWSDGEIARRVGCGHTLVAKIRKEQVGASLLGVKIAESKKVTRNGKTYEMTTEKIGKSAKKPEESPALPANEIPIHFTPRVDEPPTESMSDLDEALANGKQWDRAKRHLEVEVYAMFVSLSKLPGGVFLDDNRLQEAKGKIANVVEILRDSKPYAECPYCESGKGCKTCRKSGYVPQHLHRNAPKKEGAK